jgi:hypothetical protein
MIGLGWKLQVDDGASNAYADITGIVDLEPPDDGSWGFREKKTLDLTNGTVTREKTVKTPGEFTFTWEWDKTQYARLELLDGVAKNWKMLSTDGTAFTRIVPGILAQNKIQGVTADGGVMVQTTVGVTGHES